MAHFNRRARDAFGKLNADMHPDTPNIFFDSRIGRLNTYLDMQTVCKWALPRFAAERRKNIRVIDIGAGKGRMTRAFASMFSSCVAIEPYPAFFSELKKSTSVANVTAYCCDLSEYVSSSKERFDIAFIGGVTPYLDDDELLDFLADVKSVLEPGGVVIDRELAGNMPGSRTADTQEIARTPDELENAAERVGLRLLRKRRAYPVNPPWILYKTLPNPLTEFVWRIASHRFTFPLWQVAATLSVARDTDCFMVYMFCVDE